MGTRSYELTTELFMNRLMADIHGRNYIWRFTEGEVMDEFGEIIADLGEMIDALGAGNPTRFINQATDSKDNNLDGMERLVNGEWKIGIYSSEFSSVLPSHENSFSLPRPKNPT